VFETVLRKPLVLTEMLSKGAINAVAQQLTAEGKLVRKALVVGTKN